MSSKKQWTKIECSSLIEMYRQHTNLWDPTNTDYKNKKQDSLKEIDNFFEISTYEVDRKIKNLISQYKHERRNYKSMKKSGAGHSFVAKWFGYDAMSFLNDKNRPRKGREGGLNLHMEDSDMSSDDNSNNGPITTDHERPDHENSENHSETPSPTIEESSFAIPKETTRQTKQKPAATNIRQEAFEMMKSVYDSRKTKQDSSRDEYEVFGELVGRKIRNLKTHYAKATVQYLINNILYNADVGKYDVPTYSNPLQSSSPAPSAVSINSNDEIVFCEQQLLNNDLNTSARKEEVIHQIVEEPLVWAVATSFGLNSEND